MCLINSITGVNPMECDAHGLNSLHVAAMVGSLQLISYLLNLMPLHATSMITEKGMIPLHYLCGRTFSEGEKDKLLYILERLISYCEEESEEKEEFVARSHKSNLVCLFSFKSNEMESSGIVKWIGLG
jgi:hypothetical protein